MRCFLCCLYLLTAAAPLSAQDKADELIDAALTALRANDPEKALPLLDKAIRLDGKNARAFHLRGTARAMLRQHKQAVADFTKAVEIAPELADAYNRRGSEYFKLGEIEKSLADFDRFLKLRPKEFPGHWKRGIALYYAGKYDAGRKQFEGYEKVDTNDVENAVWHFLCVARKDGVAKARASILKIGKDRRVPMMTVYELFKGTAKPEDVLKAVKAGKPDEKEREKRLFYAHLYLGLYHDVTGDAKKALHHLTEAAKKPRVHPYMWDVARVHRDRLREQRK